MEFSFSLKRGNPDKSQILVRVKANRGRYLFLKVGSSRQSPRVSATSGSANAPEGATQKSPKTHLYLVFYAGVILSPPARCTPLKIPRK
jgi:hypothetical protein